MKRAARTAPALLLVAALMATLLAGCQKSADHAAPADRLQAIKEAGVLKVAAFDGNPPFGFVDAKTRTLAGLDVDYAKALAEKLGVKLQLLPTNPANRVALLASGKVDLVLANFTITEERARQVDFSIPYFASGTQFLAPTGTLTGKDQLDGLRIGVDKGTVNEIVIRQQFPKATLIAYDDTPFAFAALRNGAVQAISQDGPKLAGLLARAPDRVNYEIPPFAVSNDLIGVGIPKGETALKVFVDQSLRELEASGRAAQIHDAWFGPASPAPLPRSYRIGDAAPAP